MKRTNKCAIVALATSLSLFTLVSSQSTATPRKQQEQSRNSAAALHGNADYITAAQLKDYLYFVASDEMEGRGTPSRGLDATARFIATLLSRWGLKPAGDDGFYFQRIALRRNLVDAAHTYADFAGQRFTFGDDFIVNVVPGNLIAPIVYVSHGWVVKSKNIDAYDGIDVKDKIVLLAETGLPSGVTRDQLAGKQGEDWEPPLPALRRRGARAIIAIPSFGSLVDWQLRLESSTVGGVVSVEGNPSGPPLPVIRPSLRMFQVLLEGEKQTAAELFKRASAGDPAPSFALDAKKQLSVTIAFKSEPAVTQNVVAVLEGSDRALKSEYVSIGAHYDHLGKGTPVNGDAIYNGADDDGSGTAAVLAMAEAFARGPRPRRSILFIWHCGEEQLRRGSRYFVEHPTVPLNQIVVNLNLDMVGRTRSSGDVAPANRALVKPGEIYVIGSKKMSTDLGEISEAVNQSYLRLAFNYRFDDPQDSSQLFFRSDHFTYADKGIPIIFYYGGEHEDYHQPSDSADKIDYQNLEKVTRTVHATAWELANRERRPRVDKPLK